MDGLGPQVPEATTSSFTDVIESEPADGEGDTNVTEGEVKVENSGNKADDKAKVTVPKTEQELLFCKFCEFQGVDLEAYFKHVHKPSHIKRAAEAYKIRLTKDTTPTHFHCQECLISCNGENAWNQHLLGQKHRKVLEKKSAQLAELQKQRIGGGPMKTNYFGNTANRKPYEKVNRTVQQPSHNPTQALGAQDFANYAAPLIGLEYVTEIQVIGQSPRYQCSLCDAKFDHNLKFPHLVGAKHRMNVLKIKRPQVLQDSRNQTQKRSELTAMLLREARKLEEEEGRQQVKTRVEKSPFAAANISFQASAGRGGITPRGVPGARGGPGGRGSRGGRGGTGVSSRGNRGTFGGNRGMTRGNRGSPGRGNRGSPRGRGQAWSGTYNYYDDLDQTFSRPPSQYDSSPYYNDYSDDYLPYNASNDTYRPMDTYEQRSDRMLPKAYDEPSPYSQSSQIPGPSGNFSNLESSKFEDPRKQAISSTLAGALGDLTKLVQNEDDASVALHVSNALTQALLQYRMVNDQDEGSS